VTSRRRRFENRTDFGPISLKTGPDPVSGSTGRAPNMSCKLFIYNMLNDINPRNQTGILALFGPVLAQFGPCQVIEPCESKNRSLYSSSRGCSQSASNFPNDKTRRLRGIRRKRLGLCPSFRVFRVFRGFGCGSAALCRMPQTWRAPTSVVFAPSVALVGLNLSPQPPPPGDASVLFAKDWASSSKGLQNACRK
jgi:hypothetical protein